MRAAVRVLRAAVVVAVAAFASVAPRRAEAQAARVMVLVDEQHNGARAGAGAAEARLSEALLKAGFALVERFEAEQARAKVSLDRLLRGDVTGLEVSGLHADLLVAARVSVTAEQAPYGISYPVHSARAEIKVLAVDTGRVVHTDVSSANSPGDAGSAAQKVADKLAPNLVAALQRAAGPREVLELRVAGLKEARAADELAARLARVAGVKGARVRYVSADATMIDVTAPGLDPARLEPALREVHLVVARRSAGVVEARLDEAASARRRVAIAAFANRAGTPVLDWVGRALPEIVETELINSRYLVPLPGERPTADPDRPQAAPKPANADLLVVGKVDRAGAQLRVVVKAVDPKAGALVAAAEQLGEEARLGELGKELAGQLDAALFKKLAGGGSLEGYISPLGRREPRGAAPTTVAPAAAARASGPRVRVEEARIDDLFPSRIGYYAEQPLGRVVLRNDGDRPADARVEISLGELSGGPQTIRAGEVAPGARVEVPLKIVLDRKALLEVSQRRPARADLALLVGDTRQAFTEPFVLWDRNALDWTRAENVAAFVTSRDPVVRAFAADAAKEESAAAVLPSAVRASAALFDALVALGVRYARDPISPYGANPVDTVQFPRETLARRAGDCDDLATLFAALVQAAGHEARLVLTPGHIFVAVHSGMTPSQAMERLGEGRTIDRDGVAFIPVEVTRLDGGFATAWQAGVDEVGRYRAEPGKLTLVDIPTAWRTFPPFPLDTNGAPPTVDGKAQRALLAADASALAGGAGAAQAVAAAATTPEAQLARAVALAERGALGEARGALQALVDAGATPRALRGRAENDLGNIATLERRWDEAKRLYGRAADDGVARAIVEHNLGVAAWHAGRGDEARRHLERSGSDDAKRLLKRLGLASSPSAPPPKKKRTPGAAATSAGQKELESARTDEGLRAAGGFEPREALIWAGRK
jgi:TolB-like protein